MSSVAESLAASMAESLSLSDPAATFPPHLVSRILSRLPAKSLARSRSVCKEWNELISSPDFIAAHISSTEYKSHDLLILSKINKFPLDEDPVYDLYQPPFDGCRRLKAPRNRKGHGSLPVGVIHGVVCIFRGIGSKKGTVILWNPIIRKHVSIPIATDVVVEGFGYDLVTNQLKVLASRSGSGGVEFQVASHRDREWRKLTGVGCDHLGADNGVVFEHQYFRGSVHWLRYNDGNWFLVAFDCAKEEFRTMDLPEELAKCKPPKKFVWRPFGGESSSSEDEEELVVTQCVSSFSVYRVKKDSVGCDLDIWVMREYGESSSWVKVICVPLLGNIMDARVLLEDNGKFALWMIGVNRLIRYDLPEFNVKRMIEHPTLVIRSKIFEESLLLMDA